jgi:hypothetical protein
MRVRAIISPARMELSGGRPTARSPISSAAVPPWPKRMTGPKVASPAPAHHLLDGEAGEPRLRHPLADMDEHLASRVLHRLGRVEVEADAADIRLVRDVGRENLERDRRADLLRRPPRPGGIRGGPGEHRRDAIGDEHRLRLRLGEHAPLLRQHGLDHCPRRLAVGRRQVGLGRRRLEQEVLVAAVGDELHEGAHRLVRRLVGRDAVLGEETAGFERRRLAEPAGEGGHAVARPEVLDHGLGRVEAVGDCRRAVHDEDRVGVAVEEHGAERLAVALAGSVADEVDRVRPRPGRRQHRIERGHGLGREGREPAAMLLERVGRQHPGAAAIGEDRQPVPRRGLAGGQRRHRLEQLAELEDAEHAGAAEGGIVDVVGAGERPGMRQRRLGAGGTAPRLDDDDRLRPRRDAPRRHELPCIADALDIEEDRPRRRIEGEVVEEVAEIDVGHVAEGEDVGEAEAAGGGPVEDGGGDRPGLGDEGEVAGLRRQMHEARVDALRRRDEADAVRTEDAHEMRLGRLKHLLLEGMAGSGLAFAEAGGDDDGRPAAALPKLGDQPRHGLRRRGDDGEVGNHRQLGDRAVVEGRAHRLLVRVDRHDRPRKARLEQVPRQNLADRARLVARPDERDRLRLEQGIEIAGRHGAVLKASGRRTRKASLVTSQDDDRSSLGRRREGRVSRRCNCLSFTLAQRRETSSGRGRPSGRRSPPSGSRGCASPG